LEAQVALVTQSLTARGIVQNDPEKGSLSKDTVRRHVSALRAVESKLGNVSDPQALAVFTVWQIARYDQDLLNVTAEKRPAALKQKLQDLYFLPDNDSTLREEVLVLLTDADVLESQMTLRSAEELMVLSGVYGALNEDTVRFLADEFYGKKAEHRIQSLVHRFGTQPFSLKEQVELIRMAQDFLRERSLLFYHLPLQTQARLILKYLSRVGFIWTETQVPFTQVTSLLDLSQKMVGQYYLPANFHEEALVQHVWVYGVSQFKLHEASDEARVQEIFKAMAGKFSTISEPQVLFLFDELLSRHVQPVLGGYALPFDTATQLAVLSRHYVATLNAMREEFSGSIGTDLSPIRERVNQIFDAELEVMKRAPHNIFNRISLRSRARLITTYLGLKYGYEDDKPNKNIYLDVLKRIAVARHRSLGMRDISDDLFDIKSMAEEGEYDFESVVSLLQQFVDSKEVINGQETYSVIRAIVCNGIFVDAYRGISPEPCVNNSRKATNPCAFEADDGFREFCEKTVLIYSEQCAQLHPEDYKKQLYSRYFSPERKGRDSELNFKVFVLDMLNR